MSIRSATYNLASAAVAAVAQQLRTHDPIAPIESFSPEYDHFENEIIESLGDEAIECSTWHMHWINCRAPGLKACDLTGTVRHRILQNCTLMTTALLDCAPDPRALPFNHCLHKSPCVLKSFGAELTTAANFSIQNIVWDVNGHLHFLAKIASQISQKQILANFAMAGAEIACDAIIQGVEARTYCTAPWAAHAIAKFAAIAGVAAATGTSIIPYIFGTTATYVIPPLFSRVKRLLWG